MNDNKEVKKLGRPPGRTKELGDLVRSHGVSITPNQAKILIKKFGSLTTAIKSLL